MHLKLIVPLLCVSALIALLPLRADDASAPVELTGTHGRFDFIKFDAVNHRVVACHSENESLDVIDAATSKLIKSIPTGRSQGVAVDDKNGRYFVSCSKPPKLVIIDSTKLEVTGEVPLPDPADVMTYDATLDRAFVCNDEKPELWVIDPAAKTIVTTLAMPGTGMEDVGIDDKSAFLFQCLKETNDLVQVDLKEMKVVTKWPTAPVAKPHGLAMVPGSDTVLVVGGNGKLALMSQTSGQVLSTVDIATGVDEIAYDPGLKRVYCASGSGVMSVVSLDGGKLSALAPFQTAPGTHSVTVDPQTHTVWIVFGKDGKSYAQGFPQK